MPIVRSVVSATAVLTLAAATVALAQSPSPVVGTSPSGDCQPAAIEPGAVITVDVDGVAREARVYAPTTNGDARRPLVLAFHGYGGGFWDLEYTGGLSEAADAHGFVVAYPQGVGEGPTWDLQGSSDTAFATALIDELVASQCIDPARVFATGFSMGGGMTNVLACRLADRFAAIAPVAANHGETWGEPCAPSRPVPIMAFHGTLDPALPYGGGDSPFPDRPVTAVEDWMAEWANADGCDAGPTVTSVSADVDSLAWQGCAAPVVLYRVLGGGHTWPGGVNDPTFGASTDDISATELMWSFFVEASAPTAGPSAGP
jgi:polyhydroxybutyrate depolymerase